MNKSELIEHVVKKTGLAKASANAAVDAVIDGISKAVASGEGVTLVGFGAFRLKKRPARNGRNPATGEKIKIPARKVMQFATSPAFNKALNEKKKG